MFEISDGSCPNLYNFNYFIKAGDYRLCNK